eukprot:7251610-Pyramimonas_sp.AAC.1
MQCSTSMPSSLSEVVCTEGLMLRVIKPRAGCTRQGFTNAKKVTPEACGMQTQLLPEISGANYRGHLLLGADEENSTKYELVRKIKIDKSTFDLKLGSCYHEDLTDM